MKRLGCMVIGITLAACAWADGASLKYSPGGTALHGSLEASGSVAHVLGTSAQLVFAVSVVPIAIGASAELVGASVQGVSSSTSSGFAPSNNPLPIGTPLPLTTEILTIVPPNEALKPAIHPESNPVERKP